MSFGSSSRYSSEPAYRAFHIDTNGHVLRAVIINALNDNDAIELTRKLVDSHAIELWERERVIAKFGADEKWVPSPAPASCNPPSQ